jgi:hypothetical protein
VSALMTNLSGMVKLVLLAQQEQHLNQKINNVTTVLKDLLLIQLLIIAHQHFEVESDFSLMYFHKYTFDKKNGK